MSITSKIHDVYYPYLMSTSLLGTNNYDYETKARKLRNTFALKALSATKAIHRALPGLGFREKTGPVYLASFPKGDHPKITGMLHKLKTYSVFFRVPFDEPYLAEDQRAKGIELISQGSPLSAKISQLLEKVDEKHLTTFEYGVDDWAALDAIKFHLTQEHLELLTTLFNTSTLDKISDDMKQQFGIDYKEALIAEALAKSLAPLAGLDGKPISLPVKNSSGSYCLAPYTIRLSPLGDALPCYILESTDPKASPWLVIRGTESHLGKTPEGKEIRMGSSESRIADYIDEKGISRDVLTKALVKRPCIESDGVKIERPSLLETFTEWKKHGKQVHMAGHSLGGYLVNDLTNRMFDQVKTAYAFSAPGVSIKQEKTWEAKIKDQAIKTGLTPDELSRKLVNFDVEGDLVPGAGRKLIGLHVAVQQTNKWKANDPVHLHSWFNLNDSFTLQKIDTAKENQKLSRRISEKLRGSMSYYYRIKYRHSLPDWWINRKVYRQIWREKMQAAN